MVPKVGLEYELEGLHNLDIDEWSCLGWRATSDSTLRDYGVEFILRRPSLIPLAKSRISGLLDKLDNDFDISHRCSTHIHVDTRELDYFSRLSLLFGLIIHDDIFFNYGINRKFNNFSCPVLYSPTVLVAINNAVVAPFQHGGGTVTNVTGVSTLCRSDYKYLSINTMPLFNLGSIELRHFEPLVDESKAYAVLDLIDKIYQVACSLPEQDQSSAIDVWKNYTANDSVLSKNTEWVESMLHVHNTIAGGR